MLIADLFTMHVCSCSKGSGRIQASNSYLQERRVTKLLSLGSDEQLTGSFGKSNMCSTGKGLSSD